MDRLVLPGYILRHFLTDVECKGCGRAGQTLELRFPTVRRHGSVIELLYRWRCPCGGRGAMEVKLPLLFFGYVLGVLALLNANRRTRRSTLSVTPGHSKMFVSLLRDFEQAIAEWEQEPLTMPPDEEPPDGKSCGNPGPQPNDLDRLSFRLSEEEWKRFLRRMGFEENTEGDGPPS